MKLGVIKYPGSVNIGDEVQSVAAERLLPKVDEYIDREGLNTFTSDEKVKLICNGWFMEKPKNWPPSKDITPLFISFHVTNKNASHKLLTDPSLVEYYKQFEPIGCRDKGTVKLFERAGIKAYFSNCMTLTLENTYGERGDKILLVDPFRRNYTAKYRDYFTKKIVPSQYHDQVEIIEQRRKNLNASREERFKDAEALIERYAKAKLVITSRIHCALPCLALGTPVYFVNAGYGEMFSLNDRFNGIIDLFNIIDQDTFPNSSTSLKDKIIRALGLYKNKALREIDIDWENPKGNPVDIQPIANKIRETVKNFIAED